MVEILYARMFRKCFIRKFKIYRRRACVVVNSDSYLHKTPHIGDVRSFRIGFDMPARVSGGKFSNSRYISPLRSMIGRR